MNKRNGGKGKDILKLVKVPIFVLGLTLSSVRLAGASTIMPLDILSTLGFIQNLLTQIGPILSAVLFIVAGIFYALGQLFPTYKRATFHSASIDIIVGAIIVAVLSVASTGLALASTHLLSNVTSNTI